MKKLALFGNVCKYGAIGLAIAVIAKLAATFYYGYHKVDGSYGGAFYYNWRMQYLDKKVARSYYTPIKLSEQRKNDDLKRFVKMVQTEGKKGEGIYPYYAYGLPDTHVLTAKKSWGLFDTKEKMDLEMAFLEFRGRFIMEMYDLKYDPNHAYFPGSKGPAGETEEAAKKRKERALKPIAGKKYFKKMGEDAVRRHFGNPRNQFMGVTSEFSDILWKLMDKKKGYGVEFKDEKAKMTVAFEEDVMRLVRKVFRGFKIGVEDVNEFWGRVMTVKPRPMDVHILSRVNLYFLYTHSYLDADKLGNKGYEKLRKAYEELFAEEKKGGLDDTKKRKLKSVDERKHALRSELIMNKASMLLGSVLGSRGAVVASDERSMIEKLGSPRAATRKNAEDRGDTTMFDDQMRQHGKVL